MVPFLLVGALITEMQRVVIFGFDFTMLRLLLLLGFIRIILRSEYRGLNHNSIDTAVLVFTMLTFFITTLFRGTMADIVNKLGFVYSTLGIYFFIRFTIREMDDVLTTLSVFVFVCTCLAVSMVIEQRTGHNFFSIFGGVPSLTWIRDGKLRSQGAFAHPLLAGAFGATLLPVFFWVRRYGKKWIGALGIFATALITITAFSSGPILAALFGITGFFCWSMRYSVRAIRWGFLLMLLLLSLVMKAPVYALVGRITIFGSSTGYHRYILINQAVERFGEWWLLGTKSTAHWGWGLWDVTNQYIAVGVDGGITVLIAFIIMIAFAFRNVGDGIRSGAPEPVKYLLWAFGSTLFAHTVAFMGMAYFGAQIYLNWYFVLAVLALAPKLTAAPYFVHRESVPPEVQVAVPGRTTGSCLTKNNKANG